jgi:hypothetical protein
MGSQTVYWPRLPQLRFLSFYLIWFISTQLVSASVVDAFQTPGDVADPPALQANVPSGARLVNHGAEIRPSSAPSTLQAVLDAIRVMQDEYF